MDTIDTLSLFSPPYKKKKKIHYVKHIQMCTHNVVYYRTICNKKIFETTRMSIKRGNGKVNYKVS